MRFSYHCESFNFKMVNVPSVEDLTKCKLKELKEYCKSNGLAMAGTKAELVQRLRSYLLQQAEEMLLDGEDDEETKAEEVSAKPDAATFSKSDTTIDGCPPTKIAKVTTKKASAVVTDTAPPASAETASTTFQHRH